MIQQILVLLFLGINAWMDIKRQRIMLWTIPFFLLPGIIFLFCDANVAVGILALLPGFFLLLTSVATKEAVGYGDGLIVLVVGIYLGIWETCEVVLGGLFLSAVWGAVLFLKSKKGIHQEFPWIPFLFVSYLGKVVIAWIL